jgi:hypothetical protein
MSESQSNSQLLIYRSEDGRIKLDVRFEGEAAWLTQQHLAELFQTTKQNVGQHLKNIFAEGELAHDSVVKEFFTAAADGKKYATRFYNLDAIISVGYRIKSAVATQFRIWATQRLREYIVKGFVLDDERLKNPDQPFDYFEELVFATGQAMRRIPMKMADWISKLDSFLTINDREILTHAGRISRELALAHAEQHYDDFNRRRLTEAAAQPDDFEKAVKQLPPPKTKPAKKGPRR